jgi:hypothetical protein
MRRTTLIEKVYKQTINCRSPWQQGLIFSEGYLGQTGGEEASLGQTSFGKFAQHNLSVNMCKPRHPKPRISSYLLLVTIVALFVRDAAGKASLAPAGPGCKHACQGGRRVCSCRHEGRPVSAPFLPMPGLLRLKDTCSVPWEQVSGPGSMDSVTLTLNQTLIP